MSAHNARGAHSDIWDYIEGHRDEIHELTQRLHALQDRVKSLEAQTPEALRLQYEADVAAADTPNDGDWS